MPDITELGTEVSEAPAAAGQIERAPEGYEPAPSKPSLIEVYGEPDPSGDMPPEGGKLQETLYGAGEGAIQGTGFTAAALAGGQAAARGLAPMAPISPVAYGIGVGGVALGSGILGSMAMEPVADALIPELSHKDLLPYREGGKTFGETMAAAPFAFGLPKATANRVARMISDIGDKARAAKGSYLAAETAAAVTTGIAGGMSVGYDPDNPALRFGAEMTAGIFSPTKMFADAIPKVKETLLSIKSAGSLDARQQRAADRIVKLLEETGEDVPALIKRLEEDTPIDDLGGAFKDVKPSAAQKTDSPALMMLETTMAKESPRFAAELTDKGKQTIQAYRLLIGKLNEVGNPQALKLAAAFRRDLHDNLISNRLMKGEQRAAEAISKIKVDSAQTRREVGQIVRSNVEEALADAREYESALWRRAEKSRQIRGAFRSRSTGQAPDIEAPNLSEEFLEIASTITPERLQSMPKQVRSIMSRLGVTPEHIELYKVGKESPAYLETGVVPFNYRPGELNKTTAQDLVAIRSDLLELARNATVEGKSREVNFYSRMAQAVYDDIDKQLVGPEYDEARSFSRALNDHFKRTYAGNILSETRTGKALPPEVLVQKAFGANADLAAMRMEQIEDAVGLMSREYDEVVKRFGENSVQADMMREAATVSRGRIASIRDAQDKVLRVSAAKLMKVDPQTGNTRIDPAALTKFVNENEKMLKHVGLYNDMTDITRAEVALKNIAARNNYVERNIRKQMAFAKVLDHESATDAVAAVFRGKNPATDLRRIAVLAKRDGKGAMDGLRSTIYDYAFTKAGGADNFSPQAFDAAFFDPISPGLPSIYQVLQVEGVMNYDEAKNLRKLLAPMERVERAMGNKQMLEEILSGADAATELALRVVGARAGTTVAGDNSSSLIAAAAGSKYMRQLFDKAPTMMTRGIMEEAARNPQFMAELLKRGNPKNAAGLKAFEEGRLKRIVNYMETMGFRAPSAAAIMNAVNYEEEMESLPDIPEAPIKRPQASRMLQELPSVPTRGMPGLSAPAQQATAQAPAPQAPAAPETAAAGPAQGTSREMLQRLFPMDTMLG